MNKTLKKYGKVNWRSTRLANRHKSRVNLKVASVLSASCANLHAIRNVITRTEEERAKKKLVMADCVVATAKLVKEILEGKK